MLLSCKHTAGCIMLQCMGPQRQTQLCLHVPTVCILHKPSGIAALLCINFKHQIFVKASIQFSILPRAILHACICCGACATARERLSVQLLDSLHLHSSIHMLLPLLLSLAWAPCSMKLERVLWSAQPARLNLTIFTQLTVDRLDILRAQCLSYQGPLSAAAYLGVLQDPEESRTELQLKQAEQVRNAVLQIESFHAE